MHILFLTDNFPPEVNAPATRTYEHCKEWVKCGHKVTVITCAPNFPQGVLYDGYKNRLWHKEEIDNIVVIRVWTYITSNKGFSKRIIDYLSFFPGSVIASVFINKPDLVIGTSPQFFTVCAAFLSSRLKNAPFIFEVRDIWPESIKSVGAMSNGYLISMLTRIEMFLYKKACTIIVVTQSIKDNLVKRGVPSSKVHVITNGVDRKKYYPIDKDKILERQFNLSGKYVTGYIGTHGMAHALTTILDVAKRVQEERRPIEFMFVGDGAEKDNIKRTAASMALKNVKFVDSVSKQEIVKYWSLLDSSIIHLKRVDLFKGAIPSKLFEGMAMGVPVLLGVEGECEKIVNETGCGLVFEPENAQDLYDKLVFVAAQSDYKLKLKDNCQSGAKMFSREKLAASMLDIISHTK